MNKKTTYTLLSVLFAFLLISLGIWYFWKPQLPKDVIVSINGIHVPETEFRLFLDRNVAITHNYFYQGWGAQDHTEFWETTHGEQTPLDFIKNKSIEDLIELKIKQQAASDLGLAPDFTFEELLKWWERDNADRQAKEAAGEAVYGPVNRSLKQYYDYFYSNLFIQLQNKADHTLFKGTEPELRSYYEKNKEKHFQYTPEAEVDFLQFTYSGAQDKERLSERANEAKGKLRSGKSLEMLNAEYPKANYVKRVYTSEEKIYGEENPDDQLRRTAFAMQPGECNVIHSSGSFSVYLIQCISKAATKIYPYEEVKKSVLWHYRKERYDSYLDSLKQNVRLTINQSAYDQIMIK